jgi:hypothetical protein
MFTLLTSFKPLLLGGGGGPFVFVEVSVISNYVQELDLWRRF